MDLLQSLRELDEKRARLTLYGNRIGMAHWIAPRTAEKLRKLLQDRFWAVTKSREQVMSLINGDPVMSERLKRHHAEALKELEAPKAASALPTIMPISAYLRMMAGDVIKAERKERQAFEDLKEANGYYVNEEWRHDGVDVGLVNDLIDRLRVQRDADRMQRGRIVDGFLYFFHQEWKDRYGPWSLQVEAVLAQVRQEMSGQQEKAASPLKDFRRRHGRQLAKQRA